MLTADEARRLFDYEPDTGRLTWRVTLCNRAVAGSVARTKNDSGYFLVRVKGRAYRQHRVAWLIMTGSWPADEIDHVNGDRSDNRWCNLRPATRVQNAQNTARPKNATNDRRGVIWHKRAQKWVAQISVDGVTRYIGSYADQNEASRAYENAAKHLRQDFARID